jgi:hypothetical protein
MSSSSSSSSRSHSYPEASPWQPSMDNSRKGSLDAPHSSVPFLDTKVSSLNSDNGRNANGSAADMARANKTYPGKNIEDKKKTWRTSGSAVQQKVSLHLTFPLVSLYKSGQCLNLTIKNETYVLVHFPYIYSCHSGPNEA